MYCLAFTLRRLGQLPLSEEAHPEQRFCPGARCNLAKWEKGIRCFGDTGSAASLIKGAVLSTLNLMSRARRARQLIGVTGSLLDLSSDLIGENMNMHPCSLCF